jgi:hypothetical protein
MGEKGSAKIIPFPTSFTSNTKRTTEMGISSQMSAHGETTLLRLPTRPTQSSDLGIVIPTLDSLYDPNRITIGGMTVTEMLEAARSLSNPNEEIRAEFDLELRLLHGRIDFIRGINGSSVSKKLPYLDLVNHTLGVANELGELDAEKAEAFRQELRDSAIILARDIFGANEARHIIEKHDLIANTYRVSTNKPDMQPPSSQPQKLNPFTIVR